MGSRRSPRSNPPQRSKRHSKRAESALKHIRVIMRLIRIEVPVMHFGGVIVNQHYLHTLLHDVIESYYDPPKCIMSTSIIMSLIITLIVFQCCCSFVVAS